MSLNTRTAVTSAFLALALSLPLATPVRAAGDDAAATSTEAPRKKVEQRIADMYASLHITTAQEPLWNQFAQVMLDNAQAMHAVLAKSRDDAGTQSAVDVLENYASVAEQHAQNVEKLSAAFGMLYATLSADQKKAADEMFRANAARRDGKKSD